MAYSIIDGVSGLTPIATTDAGFTPTNGSTVYPSPPGAPGMIVKANDPTYGTSEFILLKGVGSTVVGSVVTYNQSTYTTTLAPAGTNIPGPVAVAMSANASTSTWGWYQISGLAVAAKTSGATIDASAAVGVSSSAGRIGASSTGNEIQGCVVAASAVASVSTIQLMLNRPHMMGRTAD